MGLVEDFEKQVSDAEDLLISSIPPELWEEITSAVKLLLTEPENMYLYGRAIGLCYAAHLMTGINCQSYFRLAKEKNV